MNIKESMSEKETAKKTTKKKSSKKKEAATAKVEDSETDESKSKDSREEKPKPSNDENAPSTNPAEENLQYVLTSTFQLFRQFVLASSLSLNLYIDVWKLTLFLCFARVSTDSIICTLGIYQVSCLRIKNKVALLTSACLWRSAMRR